MYYLNANKSKRRKQNNKILFFPDFQNSQQSNSEPLPHFQKNINFQFHQEKKRVDIMELDIFCQVNKNKSNSSYDYSSSKYAIFIFIPILQLRKILQFFQFLQNSNQSNLNFLNYVKFIFHQFLKLRIIYISVIFLTLQKFNKINLLKLLKLRKIYFYTNFKTSQNSLFIPILIKRKIIKPKYLQFLISVKYQQTKFTQNIQNSEKFNLNSYNFQFSQNSNKTNLRKFLTQKIRRFLYYKLYQIFQPVIHFFFLGGKNYQQQKFQKISYYFFKVDNSRVYLCSYTKNNSNINRQLIIINQKKDIQLAKFSNIATNLVRKFLQINATLSQTNSNIHSEDQKSVQTPFVYNSFVSFQKHKAIDEFHQKHTFNIGTIGREKSFQI
eukprot:TRINITY_DN12584_c1_g1_i5.p1 TRINITY_DN12584_c1_g1~~TRINITY_DN12584_c1_g1_i5.p1  ORF type:complete len:382 (-),score=-10.18 TRINITY_DN12584_c1_g1_i5:255-1400(-)